MGRSIHNMSGTAAYRAWRGMLSRCKRSAYEGRGIIVDPDWRGPEGFLRFFHDMGERPPGKTLDRIDNDRNYGPGNCRWATPKEQGRNRSDNIYVSVGDEHMALGDACEALGLPYTRTRSFVYYAAKNYGISVQEAFEASRVTKASWVSYKGETIPVSRACKLSGIRRSSVWRKAHIEGLTIQASFDHFVAKR